MKKLEAGDVLYYQFQDGRKNSTILTATVEAVKVKYAHLSSGVRVRLDNLLEVSDFFSTQYYRTKEEITDKTELIKLRNNAIRVPPNLTADQYRRIVDIINEPK